MTAVAIRLMMMNWAEKRQVTFVPGACDTGAKHVRSAVRTFSITSSASPFPFYRLVRHRIIPDTRTFLKSFPALYISA
jgi:hypothetical protein